MIAVRISILLAVGVLFSSVKCDSSNIDFGEEQNSLSHTITDEDIGYLNNVMEEYRRHINPRLNPEVNDPPTQDMYHYQVWKRNANIINTLLGFPYRRMLLAGR